METFTLSLFSADPNPKYNKDVLSMPSVTWEKLLQIIVQQNWSPATFANQARSLSNYRGAPSLFAFDIDEGMTLAQAVEKFRGYKCIIGTSRNHQKVKHPGQTSERPACDRFRVVFALSEPLTTENDFKATWDAYKDQYPLDKQTRNAAGFFFKCTEIIFQNEHGAPLPVVKHAEWQDLKEDIYEFVRDEKNPHRGCLSQRSKEFLSSGAKPGMFNGGLFKCAVDHLEQRYPFEEFLARLEAMVTQKIIHPLDDTDLATVKSAYNREPKYGARISGRSLIDDQKRDIVSRIMDGEFAQHIGPEATLWYQILDYENKEVARIENPDLIERHIATEIRKAENHYTGLATGTDGKKSPVTKSMKVDEVFEMWRLEGQAIELPAPILWRGAEGWCHRRMNFDLVSGLPHPHWDEFLNRLSEPEIFKAWVFSCFVPEHETRQALWLHGKSGEDGKTKVINLIAEQFGSASGSLSDSQITANSRFLLGQFLGKRLAVYPDCMNTHFPKRELFRNLTGGDFVSMEFKGKGFVSGELKVKVLIGSNSEPEMSHGGFDQSRMLVIQVEESRVKNDPGWPCQLRRELPAFLGNAKVSFDSLCQKRGKITVPEGMGERLRQIADASLGDFQIIFDEMFETSEDKTKWVEPRQLFSMFSRNGYRAGDVNQVMGKFKTFLETKYGIRKRRVGSGYLYAGLVYKTESIGQAHKEEIFGKLHP